MLRIDYLHGPRFLISGERQVFMAYIHTIFEGQRQPGYHIIELIEQNIEELRRSIADTTQPVVDPSKSTLAK